VGIKSLRSSAAALTHHYHQSAFSISSIPFINNQLTSLIAHANQQQQSMPTIVSTIYCAALALLPLLCSTFMLIQCGICKKKVGSNVVV
jgi:hypothetical protein